MWNDCSEFVEWIISSGRVQLWKCSQWMSEWEVRTWPSPGHGEKECHMFEKSTWCLRTFLVGWNKILGLSFHCYLCNHRLQKERKLISWQGTWYFLEHQDHNYSFPAPSVLHPVLTRPHPAYAAQLGVLLWIDQQQHNAERRNRKVLGCPCPTHRHGLLSCPNRLHH